MLRSLTPLTAVTIVGVLALAGCGGDDSSTSTQAAEPLTKSEFIAQADAICGEQNQIIEKAANETFSSGSAPTSEQIQEFADTMVPALRAELEGIQALTPPEADQQEVDAMLASLQTGIEQIEGDPGSLQNDPLAEASSRAQSYGLRVCGN